jgi:transglutaminase-like putative cysteine protease
MRPAPRAAYVLVNVAMMAIATLIASTTLWPIYQSAGLVVVITVSIVLGSAIAMLGSRFRWPVPVVLLVSFLSFVVVGVPVAVPDQANFGLLPSLGGLIDLLAAVVLGWKQLLTITLPVGSYEALLVPAFIVLFTSVTLGLSVALRTRVAELAVFGPVTVFFFGTAFGPTYPSRPLEAALALLAVTLLWLVWLRWDRRREAIVQLSGANAPSPASAQTQNTKAGSSAARAVFSAALVLILVTSTSVAALGFLPPTTDRVVLRSGVEQPFDPRDYVSPLAGFRRYWQPGTVDSVLFEVDGLPTGARIRLATLDSYDGVVYSVGSEQVSSRSGAFTRVPTRVDQSSVTGEAVQFDVAIVGQSGVWLPTVGQLEQLRFSGEAGPSRLASFYYNAVTGTGAIIGGLAAGDQYTVVAVDPVQPTESEFSSLRPGPATVPDPQAVPPEVAAQLGEYVGGIDGAGEQLVAMLAGLARDGYVSHGVSADEPPSRSGHSADRIAELLTAPRMIGDAEQYAVAAALMATEIGFPARVVMGFVPTDGTVRGSDVTAWVEVHTNEFGWVSIDATPPVREVPEELPIENAEVSRPQTIVPPPRLETDNIDRQRPPETVEDQVNNVDPFVEVVLAVLRTFGAIAAVLAILLSPFAAIAATKLQRRRARRLAKDPLERVRGGWREFEDAAVDHGIPVQPSSTRAEVATLVGGQQPRILAGVTDRAIFAPESPSVDDAGAVWRAVDELRKSLDAGATRWQRLKARVSVRSFRRAGSMKRTRNTGASLESRGR